MAKLRNVLQLSVTPKEYDPQKINNIFRQIIEWAKELTALVNGNLDHTDNIIANLTTGILSARPAASKSGRLYFVLGDSTPSNNNVLWVDTGTDWEAVG